MMGANIELWQYRLFDNGAFYLEEVFRRSTSLIGEDISSTNGKNPIMVAAGKKAALTRATGTYSFEEHIKNTDNDIKEIVLDLRDYILNIDEAVEESPKKFYVAYKVAQNFVCMEIKKNKIILYLKLDPSEVKEMPQNSRDVRDIGHYGTGDFELTIRKKEEAESAHKYIRAAFEIVGG
jgi:predicted transport protein